MCDQTILENGGTLKSVPDCHKNQKMCNKAVYNYHHALAFFFFFFFFAIRLKKCVIKLSRLILLQ